jgi:hypothetical protein
MLVVEPYLRRLSAHLAELTSNRTYLDAALLGANYTVNQLIDPVKQLLVANAQIALANANATCGPNAAAPKQAYQTGAFIEALAVLADVTEDAKWTSLYVTLSPEIAMLITRDGPAGCLNF